MFIVKSSQVRSIPLPPNLDSTLRYRQSTHSPKLDIEIKHLDRKNAQTRFSRSSSPNYSAGGGILNLTDHLLLAFGILLSSLTERIDS